MTMHHLHIFLSSPGDVSRERQLAREVIDQIQSERSYRDRLKLGMVAWDKPGAGTAMPAHLEPQEAIDRGLKKPSQCDIVIVIFWARMGTPLSEKHLKPDGSRYYSGTEYEFLDGLNAARKADKPDVLVYRRKNPPAVRLDDPKHDEKKKQWELVKEFFADFRNPDGSYLSCYHEYEEPSDFQHLLVQDLRELITKFLESHPLAEVPVTTEESTWKSTPFPGLRAFTPEDALIFYGRSREIDQLIYELSQSNKRFIAVVGASGTGKSSLVAAGVIPALEKNAIAGSEDWDWLRFTPAELSDNPFSELVNAFKPVLQRYGNPLRKLVEDLETNPDIFRELAAMSLEGKPKWAELLIFIDQFEELFTLVNIKYQRAFIDLLAVAAKTVRLRMLITMRADFYQRCLEWPVLDALLAKGLYTLVAPKTGALHEMISRPAELAGLRIEEGLASRILDDTGMEPGALALMAFALYELWKKSKEADGVLSHTAYESFNGVHGAIGKRAEDTFNRFRKDNEGRRNVDETALHRVFRELVDVSERGVVTRRRASLSQFTSETISEGLVKALTEARLLVTGRGKGQNPMVEVAHEAIFTSWPRLKAWIEATSDDLWLRRQVSQAAAEWDAQGHDRKYLWLDDRVVDVVGMLERLGLDIETLSDSERHFLGPIDCGTMLTELKTLDISHERRATIGVRLSLLGDPRPGVGLDTNALPDIAWCEVPGGEITIEMEQSNKLVRFLGASKTKTRHCEPFYIAKYPVTWIQYRSFLEADDGFKDSKWWQGLLFQVEEGHRQFNQRDNHPVENLCWLEAVAFSRWLTAKLGYEVRLPTEWEWQQAATGGNPENEYPWGAWDSLYANTYESGLNRSTAVGMYPHGASHVGALDMSGNVFEWCLNEYEKSDRTDVAGGARRAVRGGSWDYYKDLARCASRYSYSLYYPDFRYYGLGFRLLAQK